MIKDQTKGLTSCYKLAVSKTKLKLYFDTCQIKAFLISNQLPLRHFLAYDLMMKEQIINQIVNHLEQELTTLKSAAQAAHSAAIDEQSIAETQYDTLAIEAGYLAQGQSLRAQQVTQTIALVKNMPLTTTAKVTIGSLVQLINQHDKTLWYFIAPAAPGFKCEEDGEEITVISPESPLGKSLIGKQLDDEVTLILGTAELIANIIQLN